MSIMSEIQRLYNAKANLKVAIEAKGIEVDANSNIDAYAQDVLDIDQGVDTTDATATSTDIMEGKTAYVNDVKVTGAILDHKELEYEPSDEEQIIPQGYVDKGVVKATDITKLQEYQLCLDLANSVSTEQNYSETTATEDDIALGKTAYSNGEKLVGTMEKHQASMTTLGAGEPSKGNLIGQYITEINAKDVKIAGQFGYGFYKCTALTSIKNLDLTNTYNLLRCFAYCSNLDNVEINAPVATELGEMFCGCTNLKNISINAPKVNSCTSMFYQCTNLINAPYFDTSTCRLMSYFTQYCTNLVNLPLYNTSQVGGSGLSKFISGCNNLSDESLDNMLKMCYGSKVIYNGASAFKNLASVGFTQDQLNRCVNFDSYKNCLNQGWTTGY